ncbi:MAG: winged helix-turn-helix transcriptional regulator [Actinobacteria bacterium]|nr:winged helix-turn-helix transcriptional regulator [Actinomycetota bacterium]
MIRIGLAEHPEEHVAFAPSPLLECALSLHVLLGPKHHALHHDWVRRMRTEFDPALRRELDAFAFVFRGHLVDLFLPSARDEPETFEAEVGRMRAHPPEVALPALARPLDDHGGTGRVDPSLVAKRGGGDLVADPRAFLEALATFLERYWVEAFAAEWDTIEPVLDRAVVESGRRLASEGIWAVLGRLPAHCRVDAERRTLVVDLPHDHAIRVDADNPLVLVPSVFVWPHLRVNCDPPWPTAIVYTASSIARGAEPRIPPAELLRMLRAVADDTRLRILQLVAQRPRTTQELAPLVGLSTAGLSKSLRRLAEAGLVTARREGYYVVYTLAPARIDVLADALGRFLEDD